MKALYLLFCLLMSLTLGAQSWLLFHPDDTLYYNFGDIRLSVDSTTITGGKTTMIIRPSAATCYDCHKRFSVDSGYHYYEEKGYSFFGEKIELESNGDVVIHQLNKQLLIRPDAMPGEKWVYDAQKNDTAFVSDMYYGSVMGVNDSLKQIVSLSGDSVLLSKTIGVVTFRSASYGNVKYQLHGSELSGIGVSEPSFHELYGYQVGDVFAVSNYEEIFDMSGYLRTSASRITIVKVTRFEDKIEFLADVVSRSYLRQTFSQPSSQWTGKYYSVPHVIYKQNGIKAVPWTTGNITFELIAVGQRIYLYEDDSETKLRMIIGMGAPDYTEIFSGLWKDQPKGRRAFIEARETFGTTFLEISEGEQEFRYGMSGFIRNGDTLWGTVPSESAYLDVPEVSEIPVKIYPNPSALTISLQLPEGAVLTGGISICDVNGKEVMHFMDRSVEIDISNLNAGIYFLSVPCEKVVYRGRFVKQ